MAIDDKDIRTDDLKSKLQSGSHGGPRADDFSLGRRFGVGLNVTLSILAAGLLLVLAVWAANTDKLLYHDDWSMTGRYSLSERTRNIVSRIDKPVRITVLYDSQEPEKDREDFQPRLWNLAEEIRLAGKDVTIRDIANPSQRRDFAFSIQKKLGSGGTQYVNVVQDWEKQGVKTFADSLAAEKARIGELLQGGETWLVAFEQMSEAMWRFEQLEKELEKTKDQLSELGRGALPSYGKQTDAIKRFCSTAHTELTAVREQLTSVSELARKMKESDGGVAEGTRKNAAAVQKQFEEIAAIAGKAPTPNAEDAANRVRQVAAAFRAMASELEKEAKLLAAFAEDQPAVRRHAGWDIKIRMGPMVQSVQLDSVFGESANRMSQVALTNESIAENVVPAKLQEYMASLKEEIAEQQQQTAGAFQHVLMVLEHLKKVDATSQQLLDQAGSYLKNVTDMADSFVKRVDALPKLKFGDLADQLKDDNLVLIEVGEEGTGEYRVLSFEEVWPEVSILGPPPGPGEKREEARRNFNGDSAIGSALLSMADKAYAEAVLTYVGGGMADPRMGPQEGPLPLSQLSELRKALEQANVKITEWDLASEPFPPPPAYPERDQDAPATQPSGDPLPRVYIVLPPPSNSFRPDQVEAFADVMNHGGQALFLATFSWPQPMPPYGQMMTPEYGWAEYLQAEWGLKVRTRLRLVEGVESREEGRFGLSLPKLNWMQVNTFNEETAIGKPLQSRRVLLTDACPIERSDKTPPGVTYDWVLRVPLSNRTIWATPNMMEVFEQFQTDPESKVTVDPKDDVLPPLELMVAATRKPNAEGEKRNSRVVVFSGGMSLSDQYLSQQVLRSGEESRLIFDPPPQVNTEIAVNSVYWLADQADRIAAGPVATPVIEQMSPMEVRSIQLIVVTGLPLVVLLLGLIVVLVRRSS